MKKLKFDIIALFVLAGWVFLLYKLGIPCLVQKLTGIPCPGCGMTRAALCLLRFDISGALYYHPLVFSLAALCALFLLRQRFSEKTVITAALATAALFIAVYFVRLFLIPDSLIYIL